MLHGVWQLAKLSLTLDARRVGMHVTRFGLACVLYLALIVARWNVTVSAWGWWLFHAQLLITAFHVSMNVILSRFKVGGAYQPRQNTAGNWWAQPSLLKHRSPALQGMPGFAMGMC